MNNISGKKGHRAWNKGLTKDTDERVKKNGESVSRVWKLKPEEEKKKIVETNSGVFKNGNISWNTGLTKDTNETLNMMSTIMKGVNNPNFERKYTDEEREKIRLATTGENNPFFGHHHTEDVKDQQSKRMSGEKHWCFGKSSPMKGRKGKDHPRYGKVSSGKVGRCKRYYYQSPLQGIVSLKGSYEYKCALYLDRNNIPWLYEPKAFPLNINGWDTTYRPDFLLLTGDIKFIDTKGYMTDKAKLKIEVFMKTYPKLKLEIWYRDDLQKLGIDV